MAGVRYPSTVQVVEIENDEKMKLVSDIIDWRKEFTVSAQDDTIKIKSPTLMAKFSDDPIALSITSYLIWKSNPHRRWIPLNEVGQVTPEARVMAQDLRTYYLHRNTMKILQGHKPTEFQHKMNGLLADTRQLQQDELGLLYRLPYFWQEDLALDQVFEGAIPVDTRTVKDHPIVLAVTTHATLTPICEILKSRRSGDMIQFWFSKATGERCVYTTRADNGMISVFRSLFKRPELQVKALALCKTLPGSHIRTNFWRLAELEIE